MKRLEPKHRKSTKSLLNKMEIWTHWKICMDYLDDATEALAEAVEHLDKALENSKELREVLLEIKAGGRH